MGSTPADQAVVELVRSQSVEREEVWSAAALDDVGIREYHDDRRFLTKTLLSKIIDCPARMRYALDGNPDDDATDSMRMGVAAHMYINEYEKFTTSYYQVADSVIRNPKFKSYQEVLKLAGKRDVIKDKEVAVLERMGKSIMADPRARILLGGETIIERTMVFRFEGVPCKTRPDVSRIERDVVVDLKTTANATPEAFMRTAYDKHYDLSVAMACAAWEEVYGRPLKDYIFLVIEMKAPYIISAYSGFQRFGLAGLTYKVNGEYRMKRAIDKYKECMQSGVWPGYTTSVKAMTIPEWRLRQEERAEDDE